MSPTLDDDIARLALEAGWLDSPTIDATRSELDGSCMLGEALVQAGLLSSAQLDQLLDRLRIEHHGVSGEDRFGTNFIAGELSRKSASKPPKKGPPAS